MKASRQSPIFVLGCCLTLMAGACTTPPPRHEAPLVLPPGVRVASPIAPEIHGAGLELLVVEVDATVPEVHEAMVSAGGERDTTAEEWGRGLEVVRLDSDLLDPVLRSLHPAGVPSVTWLGMPVRWARACADDTCTIKARGWPLSMEAGEVAVVDLRLDMPEPIGRERLLLPGQVLVLMPGGSHFPLPVGGQLTPGPVTGLLTRGSVRLIAFRPRFGSDLGQDG